jgi:hypothetical protein
MAKFQVFAVPQRFIMSLAQHSEIDYQVINFDQNIAMPDTGYLRLRKRPG